MGIRLRSLSCPFDDPTLDLAAAVEIIFTELGYLYYPDLHLTSLIDLFNLILDRHLVVTDYNDVWFDLLEHPVKVQVLESQ